MQAAVVALVSLLFTSLTLTAVMSVAWRCFGRPRHALIWSVMFAIGSAQWAISLASRLYSRGPLQWYTPFFDVLGLASAWLLAAGFVERTGAGRKGLAALTMAGVASVALAIAGAAMKSDALSRAPILGFCAIAVGVAVYHARGSGRQRHPAESLAVAMLAIVVVYLVAGAVAAASLPPGGGTEKAGYRVLILLGLPTSAILIGASCIFLIASDLAQQMHMLALSDPLTGIFNRRGLERAAEPLIATCRRQGHPVAVVAADLDRFKLVNDRFGHAAGDVLLKAFTDHAQATLRGGDLFGRIGGEEFALVLPNTTPAQAEDAMERLRAGLAGSTPPHFAPLVLSASFGVAALDPSDRSLDDAFERADRALYTAKAEGRGRVIIATDNPPPSEAIDTVFG